MKGKPTFLKSNLLKGIALCGPLLLAPCLSKAQSFAYDSAVQHWPVPAGVLKISINAAGGQGGGSGGYGAVFTGLCNVVPGDTLSIVVAGMGGTSGGDGNGGGGASFVYDSNTLNLYVAAGGGGGTPYGGYTAGNGGTDLIGNTCPAGSGLDGNAADGTGGGGGAGGTGGPGPSAGGAGWLGNGTSAAGTYNSYGGYDQANGFYGGAEDDVGGDYNWGGYGGGGGGAYDGGGGGGGYNGGAGANDDASYGANSGDGGGSYLNGTLIGTANATNMGNGYVNISYISLTVNTTKACYNSSNAMAIAATSGGTGAYTYMWAPGGQTSDTVTGLSAGTYTLMVMDSVGDYDSVPVTISQAPLLTAMVTAPSAVCMGNCTNVVINGSGGIPSYSYSWSTGASSDSIMVCPDSNTTYSCTVTDSIGCTYDTAFIIKANPLPMVTLNASKDSACVSSTKDSLIGSPAGGTFSGTGVTGNNFDPSSAGMGTYTITYTYTDTLGCSSSDSIMVVVSSCTGINEVNSLDSKVKFYPNPFSQDINVTVNTNGPVTISMFNTLGEQVGTWRMEQGQHIIDAQSIPAGVYMMQVKTSNGVLNQKLIKVN